METVIKDADSTGTGSTDDVRSIIYSLSMKLCFTSRIIFRPLLQSFQRTLLEVNGQQRAFLDVFRYKCSL